MAKHHNEEEGVGATLLFLLLLKTTHRYCPMPELLMSLERFDFFNHGFLQPTTCIGMLAVPKALPSPTSTENSSTLKQSAIPCSTTTVHTPPQPPNPEVDDDEADST